MAKGWNAIWGESWKEYLQRESITNDLTAAHRESTKAMIGAINVQTASILTGVHGMGAQVSSSMDRGFSQVNSSVKQMGSAIGQGLSQVNSSVQQLGSAVGQGFNQLGSAMSDGFEMLGGQMDMVAGEISGLNASFQ